MISEADVVRAALDLEADYLDDLGKHEEAAAVRARIPNDAADVERVNASVPRRVARSDAGVTLSASSAPRGQEQEAVDPVAGEGFMLTKTAQTWDEVLGVNYESVGGLAVKTVDPETLESMSASRHHPLAIGLARSGLLFGELDARALQTMFYASRDAGVPHWQSSIVQEWQGIHDEAHFASLSRASVGRSLPERLEMYRAVIVVLDHEADWSAGRDTPWARYLRVIQSAGSALSIPGPVIAYVVSFASRRR